MRPFSYRTFVLCNFAVQLRIELLKLGESPSLARSEDAIQPFLAYVVVVVPPYVVHQLVTQDPPNVSIRPEPIIVIRAYP